MMPLIQTIPGGSTRISLVIAIVLATVALAFGIMSIGADKARAHSNAGYCTHGSTIFAGWSFRYIAHNTGTGSNHRNYYDHWYGGHFNHSVSQAGCS